MRKLENIFRTIFSFIPNTPYIFSSSSFSKHYCNFEFSFLYVIFLVSFNYGLMLFREESKMVLHPTKSKDTKTTFTTFILVSIHTETQRKEFSTLKNFSPRMSEFVEVTLKWYHGGALDVSSGKPIYVGDKITEYLNVDGDGMSYFELIGYIKELGYTTSCTFYIRPPNSAYLVDIQSDRDIFKLFQQF
ncbi:hypothetical protein H5410_050196 [Solanum commersonii]|uniref:PB1-like domain-containing protein n=1 Tax=Solanum commersonii TaxID=4109 RepID=A0A9J5WUS7_SOLCO|nr:hypothetical protein H5410_050196 [Solanum commersonii]